MSDNQEPSEEPTSPEQLNLPSRNDRTKPFPKNKPGIFVPEESFVHEGLDKRCLYKFDDTFVRVEFPGNVKNVDKALECLGGIHEIEKALDGRKLELSFHPKNQFMKKCFADMEDSVGLLVKITQDASTEKLSYEVLGASDTCFKFSRMCDFQYLPLLAKDKPETKDSDVEYMHDKIILDKIPNLQWFSKRETSTNPLFLISGSFARFDQPQGRFQLNSAELFNSIVRPEAPPLADFGNIDRPIKQQANSASIRISFLKDVDIPSQPKPQALENVKTKFFHHQLKVVKQLFDERPVWTKSGVMHKGNINPETIKFVIPCVAYYCYGGPWRTCWIKFGHNPIKDHNLRIYQVLDFRIRHTEGMQIKIKTKRTVSGNIAKDFITRRISDSIKDINYIIRPNQIPPARQMFYQYCDILIPEVQEMLLKLPKLASVLKYDPKNGWLPLSFQEHCREIVNRYVFEAVRQELWEETNEQQAIEKQQDVATYCSKMLTNIKKGFSQSIGEYSGAHTGEENIVEEIDLSDDEQIDANEVVDNLPERLSDDNFDDEDNDSDLEIDMEAVEEVNEIVSAIKDKPDCVYLH